MKRHEASTAAHNLATILTKAGINDLDKELLPTVFDKTIGNVHAAIEITNNYASTYNKFYKYALEYFETVPEYDD